MMLLLPKYSGPTVSQRHYNYRNYNIYCYFLWVPECKNIVESPRVQSSRPNHRRARINLHRKPTPIGYKIG